MRMQSGVTDQYVYFVAVDSTDYVTRETGLATFTVYRSRNGGAATAYTTPTISEISAANMPGVYALLLDEDMTIDSGDDSQEIVLHITHAGMAPVTRTIELYRPIITAGQTITVANGAADADLERIQGTVVNTPSVAGVLEVDVTHFNGVAGTFASGRPEVNMSHISGSAVSTTTAQIGVNIVQISADSAAADNCELFFDGTGYNAANSTVGTVTTVTTATNVTTVNGLAANVITAASMAADVSAEIADAVWDEDATAHQTQGTFGQAIGDPGADADTIWALVNTNLNATVSSRSSHSAADVWTSGTRTLTAGTNIDGSTFTAIPWNAAWDSEVQSEVEDALVVHRLDELLNADSDIDGAAPPTVGSVFHELMTKTAGSFTYDQTTDSLEALRDRGDAAWITATGFSTHSAADVWSSGTRTLTAATNISGPIADQVWEEAIADHSGTAGSTAEALAAAGSAGDPWATALPGAYGAGTAGKIIGDNLNATVSSRATQTSVDTIDGIVDAILVDTGTDIPATLASVPTANQNADALLDRANAIETGWSIRNTLRIMAAVLGGKVSGGGTGTEVFRNITDTKDRVTSVNDANGNRTSVTLDGS